MSLAFFITQVLNGLASAASLFIIASGLTIVFGVTRIVNFAHGSLYMLGAYVAVTVLAPLLDISRSFPMFALALLIAALATGLMGIAIEIGLLRRVYKAPELLQLLVTFGLVLIVQDLVIRIWGPLEILGPRAPGLRGAVSILGTPFPEYDLFLIAMGPLVFAGVWLLLNKTRFGVLVRAATQDREMVAALGVNQSLLFTGALFLGGALAGLGGALQIPRAAASPQMDIAVLTDAFVVTVIGGMGSVPGAALAALLIGQLTSFGIVIFPKSTLVLVFVLMAAVLIVRPQGLLGRPEPLALRIVMPEGFLNLSPLTARGWQLVFGVFAAFLALPLIADAYTLKVAIEILVFALAAFALAFLIGNGGLVSFGHAAYFGIGAYGAALAVKKLNLGMEPALLLAPLAGAGAAALFGVFIVRLSGIYLAMLTLAVAQIVYAIGVQWVDMTGGDNGVVGVWPARWAAARVSYYYLTLVVSAAGIAFLYGVLHSPFGYAVRAARDSAVRADAIGLDVTRLRWLAFVVAGAVAGLAGGLYAFSKGSIDPTLLAIPQSVDFLAMLLMGGIQQVIGALVGAAALHTLKDLTLPLTDMWRALLGGLIIAIVLVSPQGIVGGVKAVLAQRAAGEAKL
jgi:branched-chain amino acid transport system permease protein